MANKAYFNTFFSHSVEQQINGKNELTNDYIMSHQYDSFEDTKAVLLNCLVFVVSLICFLVVFLLITMCIKLKFYTEKVRLQFI